MSDEKDPYERQQEALDDVDATRDSDADRDTEREGEEVRPAGDSTPQRPQQA